MDNDPILLRNFTWHPPNERFSSSLDMRNGSLPQSYLQHFYDRMISTCWLIQVEYDYDDDDDDSEMMCRFASGVCIGSGGYIVTVTAGLKPNLSEGESVLSRKFLGRRHNDENFQELEKVYDDDESGLSVLKARLNADNGDKYYYADVYAQSLDMICRELLAIFPNMLTPFMFSRVTNALATSSFRDMAEEPQQLSRAIEGHFPSEVRAINMGHDFIPIQGLIHMDNPINQGSIWTSQCGAPIFDSVGSIVGLICMGDPSMRPSLAYAVPGSTICRCIQRLSTIEK